MNFRVGQKVVCVDDSPGSYTGRRELVLNAIYTIRGFDHECLLTGLYLEEIVDQLRLEQWPGWEPSWNPRRFRPIVERKTDISVFTKMLNTPPVKQLTLAQDEGAKT